MTTNAKEHIYYVFLQHYVNVNFQIIETYENSTDKEDMKRTLRDIADELQRGSYPIYHYLPGAEDFA